MDFTKRQKVEASIKESIRKKFLLYKPETKHMPFHYRLLGKDRMALFSFIHSLNTTFGTSIFEPVAEVLARDGHFPYVEKQYVVGNEISSTAQHEIQRIIDSLSSGVDADKVAEIERIRQVCRKGQMNKTKPVKADIFLQDLNGVTHMFDLKTAKPNASSFKDHKRTLLEWAAIYLAKNPKASVYTYIAIPYNPYEPKPYERWTLKGLFDLPKELKVADEFWDFLGGNGTYKELLNSFERVGIDLRPEIDAYFSRFNK